VKNKYSVIVILDQKKCIQSRDVGVKSNDNKGNDNKSNDNKGNDNKGNND
jgi:hypothetical protein